MSKKLDIFSLADNLAEEERERILVSGSLLILPQLENRQHEDYVEWKHWSDVLEKTRKAINDIKAILEVANAREVTFINRNFPRLPDGKLHCHTNCAVGI